MSATEVTTEKQKEETLLQQAAQLQAEGKLAEAAVLYLNLIAQQPNFWEAYQRLGITLCGLKHYEAAIAYLHLGRHLRPQNPDSLNNLAQALHLSGQFAQAAIYYQEALALKPEDALIQKNYAFNLSDQGRLSEAMALFKTLAEQHPKEPEILRGYNLTLLLEGNLKHALQETYKLRQRQREDNPTPQLIKQPMWQGEPFPDKRLLIYEEDGIEFGFGDMLQLCRYIPWAVTEFREVIVECRAPLARLLTQLHPDLIIVTRGDPLPAFDLHVSVMDLSLLYAVKMPEPIPAVSPYLRVPREWLAEIRLPMNRVPKVGLAWAGAPQRQQDQRRSCPFKHLLTLLSLPDIEFYSLQKGERAKAIAEHYCQELIRDLSPRLKDFAATAAVIAQLDLVITVDTAVAHLAGALGKAVWVLLPYNPDWRWQLNRDDSPWYPSMKLFRCPKPYAWEAVLEKICCDLAALKK